MIQGKEQEEVKATSKPKVDPGLFKKRKGAGSRKNTGQGGKENRHTWEPF